MKAVFLGPPGAGKGTQAKLLAKELAVPHISTGDMLRDAVAKKTNTGLKAKKYMDAGQLVPDAVIIAVVMERLQEADCRGGFLLDGFPRSMEQAKALDADSHSPDVVVYFDVDEETVVERLSNRRTCRSCGAIYHLKYMPSKKEGKCDKCGGELFQRSDDQPKAIRERLRIYRHETADLIGHYRQVGLLNEVRADGEVEEIHQAVLKAVGRAGESDS
ncbi:MAG: adenylate kinase [Planctomycetota bacterium]